MQDSLSVIIPAFNEEKNITGAVETVLKILNHTLKDYEIILIDDGSTDRTGIITDQLAGRNIRIRVIHNKRNSGMGYSFREALKVAEKGYVTVFPGDNDMSGECLKDLVSMRNPGRIIFAYPRNLKSRSIFRDIVSRLFIRIFNILFGLRLRYYNGAFICRRNLAVAMSLKSNGYFVYAELKIRLIKSGLYYQEIPFDHTGRKHGKSKVFSIKSMSRIGKDLLILVNDLI